MRSFQSTLEIEIRSKDGKTDSENSQTRLKQIVDNLKKIETPELNSPARVLTGRTLLTMNCIKDGRIYLTKELSSKSHGAIAFRFLLEKYALIRRQGLIGIHRELFG